jgi:hypothetical protein
MISNSVKDARRLEYMRNQGGEITAVELNDALPELPRDAASLTRLQESGQIVQGETKTVNTVVKGWPRDLDRPAFKVNG